MEIGSRLVDIEALAGVWHMDGFLSMLKDFQEVRGRRGSCKVT